MRFSIYEFDLYNFMPDFATTYPTYRVSRGSQTRQFDWDPEIQEALKNLDLLIHTVQADIAAGNSSLRNIICVQNDTINYVESDDSEEDGDTDFERISSAFNTHQIEHENRAHEYGITQDGSLN